jgi:alkylation response protein AidB-like acyl-CoA dehydrogenase
VFGAPHAIVAWGPPAGLAKAVVADGGYVVTGKWRFASGSANATWMGGHSTVCEADGKPRLDAGGKPVNRTMLFPKARATIHDIWHVSGLRATASNDYEVSGLFVPEAYTTWRDSVPDRRENGPLYNLPLLTLYGIGFSGVALGLAQACLDAFIKLAETKKPGGGLGSPNVLRDNAVVQSNVARATARLKSARAYLLQMLQEMWETSATTGKFSLEQRALLRVAITSAMDQGREVVDFAYHAAGATAIFEGSPFERRFRDMHTALAQGQAHLSNFEAAGQALMGIEPAQRL